ncbi:MAG TPA: carbonic anhydrase [Candidatus Limnocylindria bacterium]|nr:carbonic anhydrase [Candidatus Limnocylindria bacterium]
MTGMRLFEAIVDANHRAARGEKAGLRPNDFADSLPIVALTCIDPRLNPLMPEVLGIPEEHFIWLRNAGNIITGPMSSTLRSIALACAVKGGREIVIIGHTDCRVRHTSAFELMDRFRALGIERSKLPDNLNEFFGLFASERANVLKAVDFVRQSPLIGPAIPVHGLLVDIQSGALEWLVNGYNALGTATSAAAREEKWTLPSFDLGTMKFPEMKIGEGAGVADLLPSLPAEAIEKPAEPKLKVQPREREPVPIPPRILRGPPKQR